MRRPRAAPRYVRPQGARGSSLRAGKTVRDHRRGTRWLRAAWSRPRSGAGNVVTATGWAGQQWGRLRPEQDHDPTASYDDLRRSGARATSRPEGDAATRSWSTSPDQRAGKKLASTSPPTSARPTEEWSAGRREARGKQLGCLERGRQDGTTRRTRTDGTGAAPRTRPRERTASASSLGAGR